MGHEDYYVFCGSKPWCRKVFEEKVSGLNGHWRMCENPKELDKALGYDWPFATGDPAHSPTYIFFTHWGWKVPEWITDAHHCINFHMTRLPGGEGGSPLQNLILLGAEDTYVTAHKMTDRIDIGQIYKQKYLSLHGTAEDIYNRVQDTVYFIIQEILGNGVGLQIWRPEYHDGIKGHDGIEGGDVTFKRRTPEQSEMPRGTMTLRQAYDFIRMLDAQTYPPAYVQYGDLRIELTGANLYTNEIRGSFTLRLEGAE